MLINLKIKKFSTSRLLYAYDAISLHIKGNNCWHFNVYDQENFHAQLSCFEMFFLFQNNPKDLDLSYKMVPDL